MKFARHIVWVGCLIFAGNGSVSAKTPALLRLSAIEETSQLPAQCRVLFIQPYSPAQDAKLQPGHIIERINGVKPTDITQIGSLLLQSPADATIELSHASGATRMAKVHLNDKAPRLGIVCELDGWRRSGLSEAGNSALSVFDGPYALIVSGVVEEDFMFARVRIANHSDQPLTISRELLTAMDGSRKLYMPLPASDVMLRKYGAHGASLIHDTVGVDVSTEPVRGEMEKTGRANQSYEQMNADYYNKESLLPTTLQPGKMADGLVYFNKPEFFPFTITATIGNRVLHVKLDEPQPSSTLMTRRQLAEFFLAQKKNTVLRLTLKSNKVFVGKFTSFDVDNETVWFVTPAKGLLTTTSYGLSRIMNAQSAGDNSATASNEGGVHDERLLDSEFLF